MNGKLLLAVVSGALALPLAAQGVEIEASGHVNRALVFSGLSGTDDPKHTDGAASGSRFRFQGSQDLENGVTAGVTLEYGVGSAPAEGGWSPTVRHASVHLSGAFGKLTLGQTAPASHIIGYANFDEYAFLSGAEIGCDFCTASGMKSSVFTSFGAGRMEVIKYETASFGPATLSFSANGNKFWDAAIRAAGDLGGISYQLNVGYSSNPASAATPPSNKPASTAFPAALTGSAVRSQLGPGHTLVTGWRVVDGSGDADTQYTEEGEQRPANADGTPAQAISQNIYKGDRFVKGHYLRGNRQDHWLYTSGAAGKPEFDATTVSAAIAFSQGTHFNITFGQKDPDIGGNSEFTHIGIGHNIENTSVAVTYTNSDVGGGGDSWAVGIGHNLAGVELYAGYKYLDHDSKLVEDYGIAVIGSRIKFN